MATATAPPLIQVQQLPAVQAAAAPPGPPSLTFATKNIQPPTEFWVTPDDYLLVGITNGLTGVVVQIQCRIWTPEGILSVPAQAITPPADRVLRFTAIPLYYGFLYSAVAFPSGSTLPARGQTYVSLQIVRTPNQTLSAVLPMAANYVQANGPVQWPYSQNAGATAGTGAVISIAVTTPAPGADWIQTVPTGARWQIVATTAVLTTAAGGVNRFVIMVTYDNAGNIVGRYPSSIGLAPAATFGLTFASGYGLSIVGDIFVDSGYPTAMTLEAGWQIGSVTRIIQAGDQWSSIRMLIYEVSSS